MQCRLLSDTALLELLGHLSKGAPFDPFVLVDPVNKPRTEDINN